MDLHSDPTEVGLQRRTRHATTDAQVFSQARRIQQGQNIRIKSLLRHRLLFVILWRFGPMSADEAGVCLALKAQSLSQNMVTTLAQ
jgi:hypothetical protein